MALKLDMSKGYDQVEWKYLEAMLLQLGFNHRRVDLVVSLVPSVSYQVLINGYPSKVIRPQRGLRQGDPLSLYLFLLCTEGLSNLINDVVRTRSLYGIKVCRRAPMVSHLFFCRR